MRSWVRFTKWLTEDKWSADVAEPLGLPELTSISTSSEFF